ncbi:hypothetical protein C8J56DRAFT_890101 [Mycena floridula]|nr:hypothetical protein C8J56DRAFT_890101 [Mycena floridula]
MLPGRNWDLLDQFCLQTKQTQQQFNEFSHLKFAQATTFSSAKAATLLRTVYNNTDSKKGQGDLHRIRFEQNGKPFHKFPQVQGCHFGTVGAASAELLLYQKEYKQNLEMIRLKKQTSSFTNIELNMSRALDNIPTQTEWAVLAIYHQYVTIPYLEFKGIENPKLFLDEDPKAYVEATLDGGLCAEYALGGIIDGTSQDEEDLTWMPCTNDVNEGILGSYRVYMWLCSSMSLHQWNVIQMYNRNKTESFVERMFEEKDHQFMKKEKELEKAQEVHDEVDQLGKVTLITDITHITTVNPVTGKTLTVPMLQDQLDVLKALWKDPEILLKSHIPLKTQKQEALKATFLRHETCLVAQGKLPEIITETEEPIVLDDDI